MYSWLVAGRPPIGWPDPGGLLLAARRQVQGHPGTAPGKGGEGTSGCRGFFTSLPLPDHLHPGLGVAGLEGWCWAGGLVSW